MPRPGTPGSERLLQVRIPAGVEDGNQLRLTGEGEGGLLGGPPGDLYVAIHVRAHEIFVRDGAASYCELPLSFAQRRWETQSRCPVLGGTAQLTVPPGTQPGQRLTLRGKGMPQLRECVRPRRRVLRGDDRGSDAG